MTRRLVVVGADGAGMSAASQALRVAKHRGDGLEVVAFESTTDVSYSACGIPYWLAGDVDDGESLVARTAEEHRARGIDLRLRREVVSVDLEQGTVEVRDLEAAGTARVGFDELMLATGAAPIWPDWCDPLKDHPHVHAVKTLEDGATWLRLLGGDPRSALIIGGGYIGLEVAETFARRGLVTTLVTRGPEPMSSLEPEMGALVRQALEGLGVEVITGTEVSSLEADSAGRLQSACLGGEVRPVDVVAIGIGVRPRTDLVENDGLTLGESGGLQPDDSQRVRDGLWSAGDCCEVWDRILNRHYFVPLGTHASKAGRVAGTNIGARGDGGARFAGIVGTAITRVGTTEIARTGILHSWADEHGLASYAVTMDSTTAAGYMPEAEPMTVHILAEQRTGRLLGCQIVGGRGAGKRIDIAAMALWSELTVADVAASDLAYAPPFSPVWDPVQIACRKAAEAL